MHKVLLEINCTAMHVLKKCAQSYNFNNNKCSFSSVGFRLIISFFVSKRLYISVLCIYMCVYIYIYMYVYIDVCICVCVCIYVCIYVYVYGCMCVCVCVCVITYIYEKENCSLCLMPIYLLFRFVEMIFLSQTVFNSGVAP